MRKLLYIFLSGILMVIFLSSCNTLFKDGQIQNVGMLVEGTVDEEAWGEQGLEGLNKIADKYNTDVYYKENITTRRQVIDSVEEMTDKGVNLIFGHSTIYGRYFVDIADAFPQTQFVYFNGGYHAHNVTSLNLNANAMGFFAGMVAARQTKTNRVGIIAAYEWQPEVEGFYEGVKYAKPHVSVHINYVNDWDDKNTALGVYQGMRKNDVDVVYPAGNNFSEFIIKAAQKDGVYAIGYLYDQDDIAPDTVLTSTVEHIDQLYSIAAKRFNNDNLPGKVLTFDFKDDVISLTPFNDEIPKRDQKRINKVIDEYKNTGLLPNQKEK